MEASLLVGAAALTCVLWGENMQAQVFNISATIGDQTVLDEDVTISKWIDLDDISGVRQRGYGHLTDPLHTETQYYLASFEVTDAVIAAVKASAPNSFSIGDAGASSLAMKKIIKITHKNSGWYYNIELYPIPASTEEANISYIAKWGNDTSGNTFGTNFNYKPQGTKFTLYGVYKTFTSSSKTYKLYGFLVEFVGGAPVSSGSRPFIMSGEESLYGTNIDPLPPAPTGGGGGNGKFDNRTDVNVNIGIKGSGFLSGIIGDGFHFYYVPNYDELIKAMYYHINGVNNLSDWANNTMALFLSPSNYVVSATSLPCNRYVFDSTGGVYDSSIKMGGLLSWNVNAFSLSNFWGDSEEFSYDFDGMYFDDYRDFEPFTKMTLYLPYIGSVPLKASECNGGRISVVYRFEGITGKCLAMVKTTDRNGRQTGYYQYGGNAGFALPWIGNNGGGSQMIHSAASAVAGIDRKPVEQVPNGGVDVSGNFKYGAEALAALKITESYIQNTQPHMHGGFGVNTGALGADDIVLVIQRAQFANPDNYYDIHGFQTATGGVCGDYSGYTEFNLVELIDCEATQPEQNEILQLLKRGVYL